MRHQYFIFVKKFQNYTALQCERALADCHQTLKDLAGVMSEDYSIKLWTEIDALRARQLQISKSQ